jgi:hypothetical protein
MDIATARLVWGILLGIGVAVWLASLQYLLNSVRLANTAPEAGVDLSGVAPGNWVVGSAEIEGRPETLVPRATAALVKDNNMGLLKIVEQTPDRVHFEAPAQGLAAQTMQRGVPVGFRQGQLRFSALGSNRTRVDYAVELSHSMRGLLVGAAVVQVLGLIVLAAGGWAVYRFFVSADDPALRWQSVQMVQAVHFLWPPFLLAKLYRTFRGHAAARLETFVHNLPYYKD